MARGPWINPRTGKPLSPAQEKRLRRAGIRRGRYEAGKVSSRKLQSAGGHGTTPYRPSEAVREPERFERYRRREIAVRVMTAEGPYWVRGLKRQDRVKVSKHWLAVGKALDQTSDRPLNRYRNSYVGGYDDVERAAITDEEPTNFVPFGRMQLASTFAEVQNASERDLPLSFEFLYEAE